MKSPSVLEGMAVAALATGAGMVLFVLFDSLAWAVALLSLVYLLYLLWRSPRRNGRLVLLLLWGLASLLIAASAPGLVALSLAHTLLVSTIRAWLYQPQRMGLIANLGLAVLAWMAMTASLLYSGSLLLSLWTYFLLQAGFVMIPQQRLHSQGDSFDRAHRAAQAAIFRLTENSRG